MGTTRVATIALYAYIVLDPLASVLRFVDPPPAEPAVWTTIIAFFVVLACFVLVGRWIYLTNANAHVLQQRHDDQAGLGGRLVLRADRQSVHAVSGGRGTWRESHEAAGLFEDMDSSSSLCGGACGSPPVSSPT